MTTTSPRRIPRKRDSSRQAAFTFLSNISLGTESSFPPSSNRRATAVPSHSVLSPIQSSDDSLQTGSLGKQQLPITVGRHEFPSGNGKPSLQINTKATTISFNKLPKRTGGNYILSPSPKNANHNNIFNRRTSPIEIENYDEELYDFDETRERSDSLRDDAATSFLTNISLDHKKSKPYRPSRESLTSPIKENIATLEASDGLTFEVDGNQVNLIDSLSPGGFKKNRRRSSASTSKSDTSSSSANSTIPPSPNENAVSHHKSQRRRPSPNLIPKNPRNNCT